MKIVGTFLRSVHEKRTKSWCEPVRPPTLQQRGAMFEAMAFAREHGYCFFVRSRRHFRRRTYGIDTPPFERITWPVTNRPASEAR
jgi:hypothetical protein